MSSTSEAPFAFVLACVFGALLMASVPASTSGQQFSETLEPDPNMPIKEGFDTGRAIFWARPNFIPLRDPEWLSLRDARRSGRVQDDTPIVTFEVAGQTLTLVSSQMSYHHVAQGEIAGEPWMVTF